MSTLADSVLINKMVGLLRLTLLRFLATDRLGLKRARLRKQSLLPVLLAEIRNENKNPPGATKAAGGRGRPDWAYPRGSKAL